MAISPQATMPTDLSIMMYPEVATGFKWLGLIAQTPWY